MTLILIIIASLAVLFVTVVGMGLALTGLVALPILAISKTIRRMNE